MARRDQVGALADQALRSLGRLDIWVNAAAVLAETPVLETDEADLDRICAVNLKGVYWGCAAAGRAMRAGGGGSIVNVSSGGADSPAPGVAVYSMTKAAVNMLTRTAAVELGPFGVRVNAIAPGWVDTPMGVQRYRDASGKVDPATRESIVRQRAQISPLGLTGTPRDIALAMLYLASDASRFVTGQVLRPNGGVAMP
jgi:3-oxoacyl-[acyl-carrier protein] reductase